MKKYLSIALLSLFLFTACNEEKFNNLSNEIKEAPRDLLYYEIKNAREFSRIISGKPTIDTDKLVPNFEILSGKREDGTELDASYMDDVSIQNPVIVTKDLKPENYYFIDGQEITTYTAVDYTNSGVITIADENNFGIGKYSFTIKVTTNDDENNFTTIFDEAFKLDIGPELVTNLLYSPLAQNLVVGQNSKTTKPFLITGNSDVTFQLETEQDKLDIDPQTGVISLKSGYATAVNDTIYPAVNVISNISGEITRFQGESFLLLVASNTPVDLPKQTKYFFYPTLEANNKQFGYSVDVIRQGLVADNKIWVQQNPSTLANLDSSLPVISGKKGLVTNAVVGGKSEPHESDVILNSQDLSQYRLGFNLSAVFFTQNRFVEYLSDGATPTDLEIYISTDYTGNNNTATWTQINDQIESRINTNTGMSFTGTPYPGDQKGADPDGKKNSSRNADGKWVRSEFDLNPYKDEKNFTMKFKFNSYFTGEIRGSTGRAGRHIISDVHFKATEQ